MTYHWPYHSLDKAFFPLGSNGAEEALLCPREGFGPIEQGIW